MGYILPLIV